jgi:NADH:ubiquinone oxidoreductase subunit F (NADH-binding)
MTVNGHIFAADKEHAAGSAGLAELAKSYIRWVETGDAGEKSSAEKSPKQTTSPASPAMTEPPAHAHQVPKLSGLPRRDETGRVAKYEGTYRTDPYSGKEEHYGELRRLLQSPPAEGAARIRLAIKEANLRGMGGAGKPVLRKFDQVSSANSDEKYVIVNADESEPGTIKDREIMLRFPHLLLESLAIMGISVGAKKGYIYLRHEYEEQAATLLRELRWAYADRCLGQAGPEGSTSPPTPKDRFLGKNILGSGISFDIELFISPGGYVMGEQSALLNAIEGQRGMPRNQIGDLGDKKGLPSGNGLWGKPTLVSNVETYTYLPAILRNGAQWFKDQGINGCQGLKWASVCGDVERPGVFEISMGTTFREMIYQNAGGISGGKPIKAFAPSGPSFGFLPGTDSFLDLPMDFPGEGADGKPNPIKAAGATVGSGAIIVLAEGRSVVEGALNFTRFFRNESCGKCVPCRIGSQKMVDVIKLIRDESFEANKAEFARRQGVGDAAVNELVGELKREHLSTIERLSIVLESTSICGLGRVVHLPIQTVLKHFPDEVDRHLRGEAFT